MYSKIRIRLWIFHMHHIFKWFNHARFYLLFSCRFFNTINNRPYFIKDHNPRIHPLSSGLRFYYCNYFLCWIQLGCVGWDSYSSDSAHIRKLLKFLASVERLIIEYKKNFLSQLLNCRFDSFTSFMNNQNDFELIEPVEANSPSTFLFEIATIKDILYWSAFIAKVDDTPLFTQVI